MADIEGLARAHGVSAGAVRVLHDAIQRGGGRMAQFSHPELGGMGQWSAGGMTQIGAMSDDKLRDRVAALCAALASEGRQAASTGGERPASRAEAGQDRPAAPGASEATRREWWPDGLGEVSASGSQNGMRYACFPDSRRVAVEQAGQVTVYDSGPHRISGVFQQQGSGRELVFTSQDGTVRAQDLPTA